MNAVAVIDTSQKINRAQEIKGKLSLLASREPGYLTAVLAENLGLDPRFPSEKFPNYVYFRGQNSVTGEAETMKLPTRMSAEELQAFRKGDTEKGVFGFIPTSKGIQMLTHLAHSYMERGMPILEGGTALGKTYAVKSLAKLVYGNNAKILHFYCNTQIDTTELLAKYVPNTGDPAAIKVGEFLRSEQGKEWFDEKIASGHIDTNTPLERLLFDAALHLNVTLSKNNFALSFGAIPKVAMSSVNEKGQIEFDEHTQGSGCILLIDEVGTAKSAVLLALMMLRGDQELTTSFQLWEDSGRTVSFGPESFIAFATNTLKYSDRSPVDAALARSLDWQRMGELNQEDIKELVNLITINDYGHRKGGTSETSFIDITAHKDLYGLIGKAILSAHIQVAPLVDKPQAGGDRQKIPCTFEDILKALRYCNNSQVVNDEGTVDMTKTVLEAVARIYCQRFSSDTERATQYSTFKNSFLAERGHLAEVGKSLAASIQKETDKILEEMAFSLTVTDPAIIKELQAQKTINEAQLSIDSVIDDLHLKTAEELIQICAIVKQTGKSEIIQYLADKLESSSAKPSDIEIDSRWSGRDGLRKVLVGMLRGE